MLKSINDVTRLSNGVLMPWLGLGVWQAENNDAEYAVKWAVEAGYRHIDTAAVYENEVQTGKGIKECGVSRHDLFVTSKFFGPVHSFENAIASLRADAERSANGLSRSVPDPLAAAQAE